MYPHSNCDTTNYIESHWRTLKHQTLDCKVNIRMYTLVSHLIGFPDGSQPSGGTVLDRCRERAGLAEFERFSSRSFRHRRASAHRILNMESHDPGFITLIDRHSLTLTVASETSQRTTYHVWMQTQYCDCPSPHPVCKHLIACDYYIREHEPDLWSQLYPNRHLHPAPPPRPLPPVDDNEMVEVLAAEFSHMLQSQLDAVQLIQLSCRSGEEQNAANVAAELRRKIRYLRDACAPPPQIFHGSFPTSQSGARGGPFPRRTPTTAAREHPPDPRPASRAHRRLNMTSL